MSSYLPTLRQSPVPAALDPLRSPPSPPGPPQYRDTSTGLFLSNRYSRYCLLRSLPPGERGLVYYLYPIPWGFCSLLFLPKNNFKNPQEVPGPETALMISM